MKNNFFVKACAFLLCTILITVTVAAGKVSAKRVDLDPLFERCTYTAKDGFKLKYRLYVPEDYDPSKAYPCLLFLHGVGERGDDNAAQIKVGLPCMFTDADSPVYESIVIAPQCPTDYHWVMDSSSDSKPMKAVIAILDEVCQTYSVNRNRIYVTGLSMGGYGTWGALSRHSKLFAAGMPLCGGGDPSYARVLSKIPIRIFHDRNDGTVPVEASVQMYKAIKSVSDPDNILVSFKILTGYGHAIWDYVYSDRENIDWLFSINADLEPVVETRTPEPEPAETTDTRPIWMIPIIGCTITWRYALMLAAKNK